MRKARWLQLAFLGATLTFGQTQIDLRTQSKSVDFSGANTTKPFKSGTVLPSVCSVGEMFYKTNAPAGANVYGCAAANSWTLESGVILPAPAGNSGNLLSTDGTNYIWVPAPSSGTTLPGVTGNGGRVLSTDGLNFFWSTLGGDVSGQPGSEVLTQIQGHPVTASNPAAGQFLGWNASTGFWQPLTPPVSVGGTTLPSASGNGGKVLSTDGTNFFWSLPAGDVSGQVGAETVTQIQGHPVAPTAPGSGQFLGWNVSANQWQPQVPPSGTTLPSVNGNGGRVLSTDGLNFFWSTLGGDVSGQPGSEVLTQIQGHPITAGNPAAGQFLGWNAATGFWQPLTPPVSGGGSSPLPSASGNSGKVLTTDGTNFFWTLSSGDVSGQIGAEVVTQIQGHPVASTTPGSGQFLGWNASTNQWQPLVPPSGTTLPSASGNGGKVLSTDGTNFLWLTPAGDVSGQIGAETVTQIQGHPVAPTAPVAGQVLSWNGSTNQWQPQTPAASGTTLPSASGNSGKVLSTDGTNFFWSVPAGDVSGQIGAETVTQIQGHPVAPSTPASGQVLSWNGSTGRWEPQTPATGSGTTLPSVSGNGGKILSTDGTGFFWSVPAGDVSGQIGAEVVTQIQGHPVAPTAPGSGQFLGWNASANQWQPQVPPSGGTTLPSASGNGGKVLSTDGTSFFWSVPAGDVTGQIGAEVVTQIQGHPVAPTAPGSGQFLGWNASANQWQPQVPPSGGTTLPSASGNAGKVLSTDGTNFFWSVPAGDVSGQIGAETVTQIQGHPVAPTAPGNGQFLGWNASANQWQPQVPPSAGTTLPSISGNGGKVLSTDGTNFSWSSPAGDVSGQIGAETVTQIQGHPVAPTAPAGGQILAWNATTNRWEPQAPPSGGTTLPSVSGNGGRVLSTDGLNFFWSALGGDISGQPGSEVLTQIQGHPVTASNPTSGQFLGWNASTGFWQPLTPPASGGGGTTLPAVSGNAGKVLSTDGTNLNWSLLGGDITGQTGSAVVTQIQAHAVSPTLPTTGQFLGWNTTTNRWEPQTPPSSGGGGSSLPSMTGNNGRILSTDGTNPTWMSPGGDLSGTLASATVTQIQGRAIASTSPTSGQILGWNASTTRWEPQNAPISGGGTGSGASMASQLGDMALTQVNSTTLSIGANCTSSTPCNLRFGAVTYSFASGGSISLSGGTGFAYIYVTATGTLTVGHNLSLSCNGGCVAQSGVTQYPTDSIPLFTWSATNGTWDASGIDQRAFLSTKNIAAGPGITTTDSLGYTTIAADQSVVGLRTAVPASSGTVCTAGSWAVNTSFYYICVASNQWMRATLSAF